MTWATTTTRRLLALHQVHEGAHRVLTRLLARQGERNAALRQYQLCRAILARELGVEPEEETEQLYRELLRRRPREPTKEDRAAVTPPQALNGDPTRPARGADELAIADETERARSPKSPLTVLPQPKRSDGSSPPCSSTWLSPPRWPAGSIPRICGSYSTGSSARSPERSMALTGGSPIARVMACSPVLAGHSRTKTMQSGPCGLGWPRSKPWASCRFPARRRWPAGSGIATGLVVVGDPASGSDGFCGRR